MYEASDWLLTPIFHAPPPSPDTRYNIITQHCARRYSGGSIKPRIITAKWQGRYEARIILANDSPRWQTKNPGLIPSNNTSLLFEADSLAFPIGPTERRSLLPQPAQTNFEQRSAGQSITISFLQLVRQREREKEDWRASRTFVVVGPLGSESHAFPDIPASNCWLPPPILPAVRSLLLSTRSSLPLPLPLSVPSPHLSFSPRNTAALCSPPPPPARFFASWCCRCSSSSRLLLVSVRETERATGIKPGANRVHQKSNVSPSKGFHELCTRADVHLYGSYTRKAR